MLRCVKKVKALSHYRLQLLFDSGETKIFDFKPLLQMPAFKPLEDPQTFSDVYLEYGITVWLNGEIDIAPEYLYEKGIPVEIKWELEE